MRSFAIKSNDMMLVVYLSSMIRAVLALHNLIDNKEQRMWHEQQQKEGDSKALENGKLVSLASALWVWSSTVLLANGQSTYHLTCVQFIVRKSMALQVATESLETIIVAAD